MIASVRDRAPAFDAIANNYDELFTRSLIGRAQRAQVWHVLGRAFGPGEQVLEFNCGTGEDALMLGTRGVSVLGCDISPAMIDVAERRKNAEQPDSAAKFQVLPTEQINTLSERHFDGAFSNFGGLNCVEDLELVARDLAGLLKPGARLVLCLLNRICAWEIAWQMSRGNPRKAFRRVTGSGLPVRVGTSAVRVWYPRIKRVADAFSPHFHLISYRGIGICVPPSYMEGWMERHPSLLRLMTATDRVVNNWPGVRALGDHVLLHFQRKGGSSS